MKLSGLYNKSLIVIFLTRCKFSTWWILIVIKLFLMLVFKKKSNTKSGLNTKLVTVFFYFSNISNIYIGQIYKQIVIVIHVRF